MSKTAHAQSPAGSFATSRRGGLTTAEIREIEAHRAKDRPTPWPALARRYGRCETDVRALFAEPAPKLPVVVGRKNFPWNDFHVGYLIARYHLDGPDAVAKVLGCTATAAHGKAFRLGITQARGRNDQRDKAA